MTTLTEGQNGVWMFKLVGSRVTCSPPPTNTDQDILICVLPGAYDQFIEAMQADGFVFDVDEEKYRNLVRNGEGFSSLRKGEVNLVVTADSKFYHRFVAATTVATRLNLMDKDDRIALFQAVIYGNPCEPRPAKDEFA